VCSNALTLPSTFCFNQAYTVYSLTPYCFDSSTTLTPLFTFKMISFLTSRAIPAISPPSKITCILRYSLSSLWGAGQLLSIPKFSGGSVAKATRLHQKESLFDRAINDVPVRTSLRTIVTRVVGYTNLIIGKIVIKYLQQ